MIITTVYQDIKSNYFCENVLQVTCYMKSSFIAFLVLFDHCLNCVRYNVGRTKMT